MKIIFNLSVFTAFFLTGSMSGICQPVNGVKVFDSLKSYFERNYVGYADKVTPATLAAYQEHTNKAYAWAKRARSKADCYFVIDYWLDFFKDHHVSIQTPADPTTVETIHLTERSLQHVPDSAIEGIYYTMDSGYKVGIVKSNTGLRSYVGVILASGVSTWKPGQVKFELIKTDSNEYKVLGYLGSHSPYFSTIKGDLRKGLSAEGWYKNGVVPDAPPYKPLFVEEQGNAFYKKLNDSTGYLRIRSFNLIYAKGIDSVIRTNLKSIQSMPRLVIDLRWNGGGGDHAMSFLQPIVYTNPVKNIGVDLLLTPDNITAWENAVNRYREVLPKKEYDHLMQLLDQGRGKERTMVNFAADYTGTLPAVWPMPSKVAIVINNGCASATEEFLLFAKQSKKVVMAGEPSNGSLDYSNVVQKKFYGPDFQLSYPTTRSRRLEVGLGIDNVGVQPDIPLDLTSGDWLNELLMKM
jgi:hypothetical protein